MTEQGDLIAARALGNPASGCCLDPTIAKLSPRRIYQTLAGGFFGRLDYRQGGDGLVLSKYASNHLHASGKVL